MDKLEQEIRNCMYNGDKVNIYKHTQLDKRFVIVETDSVFVGEKKKGIRMFRTIDLERKESMTNVSHNFDLQILQTLAFKYDGNNSRFPLYASRMLGMEEEEVIG